MAGEIGFGAALSYCDTANGTYTAVSYITDITPPPITVNRVDKSHHGMSNAFREKTAGMGDAGEVEAKLLFDKTQQATLYALIRQDKYWRVTFPLLSGETTPSYWQCAGFLGDLSNMTPLDDKMEATTKIALSGKPTWTSGS